MEIIIYLFKICLPALESALQVYFIRLQKFIAWPERKVVRRNMPSSYTYTSTQQYVEMVSFATSILMESKV